MIEESNIDEDFVSWEQTSKLIQNGKYTIEIIPPGLYEWAEANGNINLDRPKKEMYLERARLARHYVISIAHDQNPNSLETRKHLSEYNQMRATGIYSDSEVQRIKEMAKKMVVFDMMKSKLNV